MATIEENRRHWSSYDWRSGGEEWSESWGGSSSQWWGSLWPRIRPFLPCRAAVEIACGHGRWSEFLVGQADSLELFDLTPEAVEACTLRFAEHRHVRVRQTDGKSLPGVGTGAIDFVFSFDSLVHAEIEVLVSYVEEIARVLSPGGAAFLHHSNVAALLAEPPAGFENRHWRAESASAVAVAEAAEASGLVCSGQELVNWGCPWLTDVFSLVTRPGSRWERPLRRVENPDFMAEATSFGRASRAFGEAGFRPDPASATGLSGWWRRKRR